MPANTINRPNEIRYGIICHPIKDWWYEVSVEPTQRMDTGLPIAIHKANRSTMLDLLFSEYEDNVDGELHTYTPYPITWSVGYDEQDAIDTISIVNSLFANEVLLSPIKHPDRDEWALPWSDHIISSAPDGALKDAIISKHEESVLEGNSLSKAEVISDGWG